MPSKQVGNVGNNARVAVGDNITWIEGFDANEVRKLIESTTRAEGQATRTLTRELIDLSMRLGVTEDAVKTLLRIVGEQDAPPDQLPVILRQVADEYKQLRERVAVLEPDDATTSALISRATALIDSGDLRAADTVLQEALVSVIKTVNDARRLRQEAQDAERLKMINWQFISQLSHSLSSRMSEESKNLYEATKKDLAAKIR